MDLGERVHACRPGRVVLPGLLTDRRRRRCGSRGRRGLQRPRWSPTERCDVQLSHRLSTPAAVCMGGSWHEERRCPKLLARLCARGRVSAAKRGPAFRLHTLLSTPSQSAPCVWSTVQEAKSCASMPSRITDMPSCEKSHGVEPLSSWSMTPRTLQPTRLCRPCCSLPA